MISLTRILNTKIDGNTRHANKRPLSEVNSGDLVFVINDRGDVAFNPKTRYIMEKFILGEDPYISLPLNQERFINRFLYEANKKTNNSSYELTNMITLLDRYLASVDITTEYAAEEENTYVIIPFETIQGLFD